MSVDLSKCNVGDKCVTRCGKKVSITEIHMEFSYPIVCSDGESRNLSGEYIRGDVYGADIVSVCEQARRNVAKVKLLNCGDGRICAEIWIESWKIDKFFSSRRSAVRDARQFCALIGFEMEITK